jgi:hypothetical protein
MVTTAAHGGEAMRRVVLAMQQSLRFFFLPITARAFDAGAVVHRYARLPERASAG